MALSQSSGMSRNDKKNNSNEIDVTGSIHVFQVKGSTYPPLRRLNNGKKFPDCKYCDQNEQYIDILEARLDNLDNVVQTLTGLVKIEDFDCFGNKKRFSFPIRTLDFSKINTDELLEMSEKIQYDIYGTVQAQLQSEKNG
ncbi:hypothetical protein G9A89_011538 [Geosiphon pyriformis]|nr:hypothetical protein G9A89_011538 [Geosiphon pyriformis]